MPAAKIKRGDNLSCEVCGLVLTVDELCGCMEAHEIICCDLPMKKTRAASKPTKAKAKSTARPKARARAK